MLFTIGRFLLILLFILVPLLYAAPRASLGPLEHVIVYLSATLGLLLFLYELLKERPGGSDDATVRLLTATYSEIKSLSGSQRTSSSQVQELYRIAKDSADLESLRDELRTEQDKSNSYARLLADVRDSAQDSERCIQELEAELQRRLLETTELGKQLAQVHGELEALRKSQEARLSQVLPAELLASEVGDTVRWASEAVTQQDVIAANLFASLQSLFASQLDPDASGQSLDYLPALGKALSKMARREGWSSSRRHEMFSSWARVLNSLSRNDFTLYVPDIGARVRNDTMNGLHEGTVSEVHCWGVRNHKQGIAYMAEVG